MLDMAQSTATCATQNAALAAYLLTEGFELVKIEGPRRRRVFTFAKPIPPTLILNFPSSPAGRLIDNYRSLLFQIGQMADDA
jgi:hypothetical protein